MNDEENGIYICKKCDGKKYITIYDLQINEPCEYCDVTGHHTWIDQVFGKEKKTNYHEGFINDNISYLIHILKDYCSRCNLEATITIEPRVHYSYEQALYDDRRR